MIDKLFEKIGLSVIPSVARYVIVILMLTSPILGICYLLIFDSDDEPPVIRKRPASKVAPSAEAKDAPKSSSKREKLD